MRIDANASVAPSKIRHACARPELIGKLDFIEEQPICQFERIRKSFFQNSLKHFEIHNTLDSFKWLTTGDKFACMYALQIQYEPIWPLLFSMCCVRSERKGGIRKCIEAKCSTRKNRQLSKFDSIVCGMSASQFSACYMLNNNNNNNKKTPSHFLWSEHTRIFIELVWCAYFISRSARLLLCSNIVFLSPPTCKPNHFFFRFGEAEIK